MEEKKRKRMSWLDVHQLAHHIASTIHNHPNPTRSQGILLYGVPRGGIYPALQVQGWLQAWGNQCLLVDDPNDAEYIIDDIIDTGRTKESYQKLDKPFYALVENSTDWIVFPWEAQKNEFGPTENVVRLLEYIGEDPNREGLKETPDRVVRSFEKLYGGYKQKPEDVMKVFEDGACDEMVVLKGIEMYSTCEHHMLPFYGKAHIAYLPDKQVVGISKLARLLEIYSRRLQIQERIGQQVTSDLMTMLKPKGAACVIEAQHFCMTSRGVEKQNSIMVTSSLVGAFKDDQITRNEFMSLIGK